MIFDKLSALLGFAAKSGKLVAGDMACEQALLGSKAKLVLIDSRTAQNTLDKFMRLADETNAKLAVCPVGFEADRYVGREGRRVFAVMDEGFANAIVHAIEKMTNGIEQPGV